ncbi:MAG: hypothetical protein R3259_03375 [Salinimicrobium sediminis]|nr:hypothetical protein [Salinimicrobium sediminis]
MKKLFPFLLLLTGINLSCIRDQETQVLVLPTIHGAHEVNENYTYDDLLQLVKSYEPDVIGVEIRPEDFNLSTDSLDLFYPLEMIMVRDSFPGKVSGIDYYNEETRNITVSRKMFSDTVSEMYSIKRLTQDMRLDSAFVTSYEKTKIPEIQEEQRRMALNYSAEEFLKGEYDSITGLQYQIEDSLFGNSPYAAYPVFNNRRDLQITLNALQLVEKNPGKKILLLVGANHRNRLVDSLENRQVDLIKDLNFRRD